MLSKPAIIKSLLQNIRLSRGKFVPACGTLKDTVEECDEIPPSDILIPLIEDLDDSWPFDVEPDPRAVGTLIETLRGCRFYRDGDSDEIAFAFDRQRSRYLGAYDTPSPVVEYLTCEAVTPLCDQESPPLILDPACGAGYFLHAALDLLVKRYPDFDPATLAEEHLRGFDLDPSAIALARRNLAWHLEGFYKIKPESRLLSEVILETDALAEAGDLPLPLGSVDVVLGNPPYQFFSGRGSPVAALRRDGKHSEAKILSEEISRLSGRFPRSSHGCRDRYKWFIDRATQFLSPGGRLGFITPNTWLVYPRYHDIRSLLSRDGRIEAVIDLGSLAFHRAHVPASTLIWRKESTGNRMPFPRAKLEKDEWESAMSGDSNALPKAVSLAPHVKIAHHGDIVEVTSKPQTEDEHTELVNFLLDAPPVPSILPGSHRVPLGDVAIIHEGSHAIKAVRKDAPREPSAGADYPVLIDKTFGSLIPPEVGYIEPPINSPAHDIDHSGQRFLIRKTGDRLVVAPCLSDRFALAHQNVYVGKIRDQSIPFLTLVGILSSSLLTGLYRAGPGGQHRRPHAQLRILFLNRLPIIVVPTEWSDKTTVAGDDADAMVEQFKAGNFDQFDPVSKYFPEKTSGAEEVAPRIALFHQAIVNVVEELISDPNEGSRQALDHLVYHLYGGYKQT